MKKHIITLSIVASLIVTLLTSCMTPLDGMPCNDKDFTKAIQFFDNSVCNSIIDYKDPSAIDEYNFIGKVRIVGNKFSIIDEAGGDVLSFTYYVTNTSSTSKKDQMKTPTGFTSVASTDAIITVSNCKEAAINGEHSILYAHTKAYDKILILLDDGTTSGKIRILELVK